MPNTLTIDLIATRLVRAEMTEAGVKRDAAERAVARRIGVAPGTLENLRRGRLINVERIAGPVRKAWRDALKRWAGNLRNELNIALETDDGDGLSDLAAMELVLVQIEEKLAAVRAKEGMK